MPGSGDKVTRTDFVLILVDLSISRERQTFISWKHLSYHLTVASSLCLDVEYLFGRFQPFFCWWWFGSCDFGVFVWGGELKSSYSAILSPASGRQTFRCWCISQVVRAEMRKTNRAEAQSRHPTTLGDQGGLLEEETSYLRPKRCMWLLLRMR